MAHDVDEPTSQGAGTAGVRFSRSVYNGSRLIRFSLLAPHNRQNAPSGIAQLRKSSEQAGKNDDDPMNLEDFIVPSSIGSPAGVSSPTASSIPEETLSSAASTASAIPIKQLQKSLAEELLLSRASAPSVTSVEHGRSNEEFGYVPRHVRKTSVDERRVRTYLPLTMHCADRRSHRNDEPKRRHMFLRSTVINCYFKIL